MNDKPISTEIENADPATVDKETLARWAREVARLETRSRDFVMVPRDCNKRVPLCQ